VWGRLANQDFKNESVKSAFFFCGNWRNGAQFYEYDPTVNTGLYTVHPSDARHLGWSENAANRNFAVNTMIGVGVNVVNMSDWGPRGTDNWAADAPMQTSTYAHDQLFTAAVGKHILIAPYLESYSATANHPAFSFREDFPGLLSDPAPALIARINDLVDRYLINPADPAWPERWAKMYNRTGQARYVISIIHAASNQASLTDQQFAAGFDRVAERVYADKGVRIGFTLDVLPSGSLAAGTFKANPNGTGPYLAQQSSILAIQCFIPEIHTGLSDESDLAAWKSGFSAGWIATGIPFIQDVSPGYDAHVVFPAGVVYGNNNAWRQAQTLMVTGLSSAGLTFNVWNGYTEGFAGMPTTQYGTANYNWAMTLFAHDF
jgi:hypothetical protein